jgi:L-alanine-DL-glutamate epimerase-like enolase superfamily enzyme
MKITRIVPFQLDWAEPGRPGADTAGGRGAFVRVETEDGLFGLGEASPMEGGFVPLSIIARRMAPFLVGKDFFDHEVLQEQLFHKLVKLGPEYAVTSALAALDIAFWDLKGKALGQPVYRLLGGAWRTTMPCYASIGGNGARSVDEVLRVVEGRVAKEGVKAVKIRWDGDRTVIDADISGDIAKARAVRNMLGDDFTLGFDANNGYSVGGAMRVGRALEELGYAWFEEPVQHYHVAAMGEVAQRLSITVSAGEQTYTLQGVKDLINAGVRMVQPDPVKMGGITGLHQCAALAHAHGVELVPHQTQPSIGHLANMHIMATVMHLAKPVELNSGWERASLVFRNPSEPTNGHVSLPSAPGLGAEFDAAEMQRRTIPIS